MRIAGALASQVLNHVTDYVQAGIETAELDQLCHDFITGDLDAIPAPLNYRGFFPKSICTSVNHVVCHGIPSAKKLKNGDIFNIDITVIKDGFTATPVECFSLVNRRSAHTVLSPAHMMQWWLAFDR
ncbi:MAG: hypothetical protein CM1200mP41_33620 [Gammaproteobacteria bacterium]|nr:MAG: hypothetical protein CM1200mP41_33620 [Gammaproteobacteria bacterium]